MYTSYTYTQLSLSATRSRNPTSRHRDEVRRRRRRRRRRRCLQRRRRESERRRDGAAERAGRQRVSSPLRSNVTRERARERDEAAVVQKVCASRLWQNPRARGVLTTAPRR